MVEKDKSSLAGHGFGNLIMSALLVMVAGAGAGFGYGKSIHRNIIANPAPVSSAKNNPVSDAAATHSPEAESWKKDQSDPLLDHIVPLEPVIVNLIGSNKTWIRLEGSVAFLAPPEKNRAPLTAEIAEDLVGFLRGVSLSQLESAAGLEFLREDISEIVRLRSKGRAHRFLVRSLVVE